MNQKLLAERLHFDIEICQQYMHISVFIILRSQNRFHALAVNKAKKNHTTKKVRSLPEIASRA